MRTYADQRAALEGVLRLSRAMTYKFAVAGLPKVGGKAVIALPTDFDAQSRPDPLRRDGTLIRQLCGLFMTAPDVGTSSADRDIIAETGAPYIFGRTPAAGGMGDTGPITGLGVFAGIPVACEHVFGDAALKGRRVVVRGTGQVGASLIGHLRAAGAEVLFSDSTEASIRHFRDELGLTFVPSEASSGTDGDVFARCALGGIVDAATIGQLKCRVVAGGQQSIRGPRRRGKAESQGNPLRARLRHQRRCGDSRAWDRDDGLVVSAG